ncbi:hypothetical protein QZH41_000469 [Actinostola sp. cb2023]|nr:hypothetical protein QZH41_000469 [Actinostola sp. cb2023]
MKDKAIRGVCFSPDKIKVMKSTYEKSPPIKITNYRIKRNQYTLEDELHLNKRTRLSDPDEKEVNFNLVEQPNEEDTATFATVSDIVDNKTKNKINIVGRITFQGDTETINTNGKVLTKQETLFTDDSGSIRLVLWEGDMKRVSSGSSYQITKAIKKTYQEDAYLTLNRQTVIQPSDTIITRDDDQLLDAVNTKQVSFPAEGVEIITSYLSCKKCNAGLPQTDERKVVQCTKCGCGQLRSSCKENTVVKALFLNNNEQVSLTIFNDKLCQLHNMFKEQSPSDKPFDQLDDDDIMELLLTVQAVVNYNSKFNITSIQPKDH